MSNSVFISGLNKAYRSNGGQINKVYESFDLKIDSSLRYVCLTGPDGSGKSTLLKILSGVILPDGGKVLLDGRVPSNTDPKFTKDVGYMSQTLGLYGELSVIDNLKIYAGLKGVNLKRQLHELESLLDQVSLLKFKDRNADALSGGMKQKLGLACAIAAKPKYLILDEPTVGVDPISRSELWSIIKDYADKSKAICLFSSAYLDEAASADVTIMLKDGKIVMQGDSSLLASTVKDRVFSITTTSALPYQKTVRALMFSSCQYLEASPILDICPRLGRIDVLLKPNVSLEQLENFILKRLPLYASKLSVRQRQPVLEDAYVGKSLELSPPKKLTLPSIGGFDPSKTVITVNGIKKNFGKFTAVHSSTFNVKQGEIFGLLGPNGAGKTTTFRMICALLKPSAGIIRINNLNLQKAKSEARASIGYVSQKFSLYRKLSLRQNLNYFGLSYGLYGRALHQRIEELLEEFNLNKFAESKSEDLPFGIQRQLSMACALIHKPKILFLDEATSGADPAARRNFWNRIIVLASGGTSIIVTTHFMEEAEYCDHFLIQDQGKILVLGSPNDICLDQGHRISVKEAFVNLVEKFRSKEA